jgi:hypothetical protein
VSFEDFVDRYRDVCMPATQVLHASTHANTCIRILQTADLHGWAKGRSKMLLQYEHVRVLVDILEGKKVRTGRCVHFWAATLPLQ